jgi:adenylosuccinate lyase
VVRRIVLPDAFFALDAVLDTTMRIVDGLVINQKRISAEVDENIPFLLSSSILMCAVKNGAGREQAHTTIKKLANQARTQGINVRDNFFASVLQEKSLRVTEEDLTLMMSKDGLVSGPIAQVNRLTEKVLEKIGNSDALRVYVPEKLI